MEVVKRLELDLWEATEKQTQLQNDLRTIINENETYRKINSDLQTTGTSSLQNKEFTDKLSYEKKRREKTEKELELFKNEFDNQLNQQLDLAVADARAELHGQIEKTKQIAEEQSKVYDELESYKLQLTAAEQIITENTEAKRQGDLEIARLREKLSNRDKTVEKMIKECTMECEERVRLERTQHQKTQNDFEVRVADLQREASLAKAAEERAKRGQQRAEINLTNERESSGVGRLEEEVQSLRIKCESLDRLRHETLDECRLIREDQTKAKLEFERELAAKVQKIDKLSIQTENLKNDVIKASDKKHDTDDELASLRMQVENLKDKNNVALSAALAEQAKKIEQTRAEAQHWKAAYEVLSDENSTNSDQLNMLYQKERNLNKKYRNEMSVLQAAYESKLRKISSQLKQQKYAQKY